MKLITSAILTSAQANIQFNSITDAFDDLVVIMSLRNSSTDTGGTISFNTGGTYSRKRSLGSGTALSGDSAAVDFQSCPSGASANTFSNGTIYIPNYKGSTAKPYSSTSANENTGSAAAMSMIAGLWSGTAAITSLTLTPTTGNFVSGCVVSLYGITRGSDGIVTVS